MASMAEIRQQVNTTPKKIVRALYAKWQSTQRPEYLTYVQEEIAASSHPPNGIYRLTDDGWKFNMKWLGLDNRVDRHVQTESQALNVFQTMKNIGNGMLRYEIQDKLYELTNELNARTTEVERALANLRINSGPLKRYAELLGIKPKKNKKPMTPLIEFTDFPENYGLLKRDYGTAADIVLEGLKDYGKVLFTRTRDEMTWEIVLDQLPGDVQHSIVIDTRTSKGITYSWMVDNTQKKEIDPIRIMDDFLPAYKQKIIAEKHKLIKVKQ